RDAQTQVAEATEWQGQTFQDCHTLRNPFFRRAPPPQASWFEHSDNGCTHSTGVVSPRPDSDHPALGNTGRLKSTACCQSILLCRARIETVRPEGPARAYIEKQVDTAS